MLVYSEAHIACDKNQTLAVTGIVDLARERGSDVSDAVLLLVCLQAQILGRHCSKTEALSTPQQHPLAMAVQPAANAAR